jgi:RecG-like helicase
MLMMFATPAPRNFAVSFITSVAYASPATVAS